jgi:hypothetical protein
MMVTTGMIVIAAEVFVDRHRRRPPVVKKLDRHSG